MVQQVVIPQKEDDLATIAQALGIAANAYGIYSNREKLLNEEKRLKAEEEKEAKKLAMEGVITPEKEAAYRKEGFKIVASDMPGATVFKTPEGKSVGLALPEKADSKKYSTVQVGNDLYAFDPTSGKLGSKLGPAKVEAKKADDAITPAQKAVDQNFAKWYAEEVATGNIANLGSNIKKLKEARDIIAEGGVTGDTSGKVLGVLPDFATDVLSSKRADVRDTVYGVAQESLKTILGSQFTAKEGEGVLKRSFNMRLSPEANVERLDKLIGKLEAAAQQKVDAAKFYEEKGTLQGFKGRIVNKLDDILSSESMIAGRKNIESPGVIKSVLDKVETKATATPPFNPDRYLGK